MLHLDYPADIQTQVKIIHYDLYITKSSNFVDDLLAIDT